MVGHHRSTTERRPGIAVVRPRLHEDTRENRSMFRRWTKLHMRDTLSLPRDEELGGASRVLRYTRSTEDGGEEYFYTIVLDDVRLPGTESFRQVPQRLDLENTRPLQEDEEPVLQAGDERIGTEPMVFSLVAPVVSVFAETRNTDLDRAGNDLWMPYQELPADVATLENASSCKLVTLTIDAPGSADAYFKAVRNLHSSLVNFLATATQRVLYTSLYKHNEQVQPSSLPKIAEGEHGCGAWVVCVLVGGDADEKLLDAGLEGVEGQVKEWFKRVRLSGSMEGVNVKTGVWNGDVFMS